MVPYAASFSWYAAWFKALALGMTPDRAEAYANHTDNVKGKGFTRCHINGVAGETLLSIPVEGGAARLKKESAIPALKISEHGNWRHVHQGALNAAYGRSPYFQHLMPCLAEVYHCGELSLSRFNSLLHEALIRFLFGNPDHISASLRAISGSHTLSVSCRSKELAVMIQSGISIIDPLMRFGRETLLPLLNVDSLLPTHDSDATPLTGIPPSQQ